MQPTNHDDDDDDEVRVFALVEQRVNNRCDGPHWTDAKRPLLMVDGWGSRGVSLLPTSLPPEVDYALVIEVSLIHVRNRGERGESDLEMDLASKFCTSLIS